MYKTFLPDIFNADDRILSGGSIAGVCQLFCCKYIGIIFFADWELAGEPHLFNGRVYIYGSHDEANGTAYCHGDCVIWSAPEDNLKDRRYEGIIYRRTQDPSNSDDKMQPFVCFPPGIILMLQQLRMVRCWDTNTSQ